MVKHFKHSVKCVPTNLSSIALTTLIFIYQKPVLLVSSEDYDNIEFVGEPLTISGELSNDLAENGLI